MTAEAEVRGFRAPGTTFMVAGSLIGAVAAYLFQFIGARALGSVEFAPIAVLWTSFFILATVVLIPLEQYVTREASRGRRVLRADRRAILTVVGLASLGGAAFALVTREGLFAGRFVFVLQIALVTWGYGVLTVGKGILAGHRRFRGVGWILVWEGVSRLLAALLILTFARTAPALAWAIVVAPFAAALTRYWRHDREVREAVVPTPAGGFLGAYIAGSAASQVLLAAAPLGVAALGGGPELVSIVFVTFTLYRGPLTLIYSLQGRILPYLVRMAADDHHGLRRMALGVLAGGAALAALGAVVGWFIGPEVVSLLFGEEFTPDRVVATMAAAGVLAASTAQIAGQVLVAGGRTGRLATAWMVGLLVALATLVVAGLSPDRTVALAFLLGESAAAATVGVLTLLRRSG